MILILVLTSVASYEVPQSIGFNYLKPFYSSFSDTNVAKVKYYKDRGLGIQMQKPVHIGESGICISKSNLIRHTDNFIFSNYISHLPASDKLVARILYEKFMGPMDNFLNTYIHSLPTKIHNPLLWSAATREFFSRFNIHPELESKLNKTEQHKAFKTALENIIGIKKDILRYESYVWALKIVESRSVSFYNEDNEKVYTLMPMLDIVNYWPSPRTDISSYVFSQDELCLVSSLDRQPGDELFASYSEYESSKFFFAYGITLYDYPFDFLKVVFEGNKEIKLYARRLSTELLEAFCKYLGSSIAFEDFRSTIVKIKEKELMKIVFKALSAYRKYAIMPMINDDKPGIREVRRLESENEDKQKILKFVLATRKTFYRHREAFEREFAFTLFKNIFD